MEMLDDWFPPDSRTLTLVAGDAWRRFTSASDIVWFVQQCAPDRIERTFVLVTGNVRGRSLELRATKQPTCERGLLILPEVVGWVTHPTGDRKTPSNRTSCDFGPNRPTLHVDMEGRIDLAV